MSLLLNTLNNANSAEDLGRGSQDAQTRFGRPRTVLEGQGCPRTGTLDWEIATYLATRVETTNPADVVVLAVGAHRARSAAATVYDDVRSPGRV